MSYHRQDDLDPTILIKRLPVSLVKQVHPKRKFPYALLHLHAFAIGEMSLRAVWDITDHAEPEDASDSSGRPYLTRSRYISEKGRDPVTSRISLRRGKLCHWWSFCELTSNEAASQKEHEGQQERKILAIIFHAIYIFSRYFYLLQFWLVEVIIRRVCGIIKVPKTFGRLASSCQIYRCCSQYSDAMMMMIKYHSENYHNKNEYQYCTCITVRVYRTNLCTDIYIIPIPGCTVQYMYLPWSTRRGKYF